MRAEIGARSIVGANALVALGAKIPSGSLVLGSPAKVKRALTHDNKNIARWPGAMLRPANIFMSLIQITPKAFRSASIG
jgi:carbonic anhydrase/acetyltransferase-like protein (isoleucine patch superfamily)